MLTPDEVSFLKAYGLAPKDVFDARLFTAAQAKEMAKKAGQSVMIGSACRAAGHRLRTRANHCVQCDPKKLAFQNRHAAEAFVYVLGSHKARLFKVGSTGDLSQRLDRVNYQAYGGASDWRSVWHMRIEESGRVEFEIHAKLARYAVDGTYVKDGVQQGTRELFRAPLMRVLTAAHEVIGPTVNQGDLSDDHDDYNWI